MVVFYGYRILQGILLHGSFCMGRRLRNKKVGVCGQPFRLKTKKSLVVSSLSYYGKHGRSKLGSRELVLSFILYYYVQLCINNKSQCDK